MCQVSVLRRAPVQPALPAGGGPPRAGVRAADQLGLPAPRHRGLPQAVLLVQRHHGHQGALAAGQPARHLGPARHAHGPPRDTEAGVQEEELHCGLHPEPLQAEAVLRGGDPARDRRARHQRLHHLREPQPRHGPAGALPRHVHPQPLLHRQHPLLRRGRLHLHLPGRGR